MHIQKNKIKFWKLCGKFHLQWWVSLKIERLQIWWFIMVCHSDYSPAYIAVENCTFIDYLPLRMVIFHGYVSLPEGILWGIPWIGGIPCEFFFLEEPEPWRVCTVDAGEYFHKCWSNKSKKNLLQVPTGATGVCGMPHTPVGAVSFYDVSISLGIQISTLEMPFCMLLILFQIPIWAKHSLLTTKCNLCPNAQNTTLSQFTQPVCLPSNFFPSLVTPKVLCFSSSLCPGWWNGVCFSSSMCPSQFPSSSFSSSFCGFPVFF